MLFLLVKADMLLLLSSPGLVLWLLEIQTGFARLLWENKKTAIWLHQKAQLSMRLTMSLLVTFPPDKL